jgi:hypothetical protein
MHLLDKCGVNGSEPLALAGNQTVSEKLRTPVARIKKLRYDAALKFGDSIEDQAMGRLLAVLSKASLETDDGKICLIIEDSLAKNWLQGRLKTHQHIFDNSFNTEIVKVSSEGLFTVLETIFNKAELKKFKSGYESAKKKKGDAAKVKAFKDVAKRFAEGAAKAAGSSVVNVLRAHIGVV